MIFFTRFHILGSSLSYTESSSHDVSCTRWVMLTALMFSGCTDLSTMHFFALSFHSTVISITIDIKTVRKGIGSKFTQHARKGLRCALKPKLDRSFPYSPQDEESN